MKVDHEKESDMTNFMYMRRQTIEYQRLRSSRTVETVKEGTLLIEVIVLKIILVL